MKLWQIVVIGAVAAAVAWYVFAPQKGVGYYGLSRFDLWMRKTTGGAIPKGAPQPITPLVQYQGG